ncbi:MAG: 2-dehydro-3-deoxygalactonokinase [Planctomycetia bacterium]
MTAVLQPAVIGLDWGTSSLRGYLLAADGGVVDSIAKPWGIQHLPAGGFAVAFQEVVAAWRGRDQAVASLPVLAAGMVGSRQGWREVPYVECPADAAAIARGLVAFDSEAGRIHLVPGVIQRGLLPNVLRGEETQIVGALAREPALAAESLVVLPGTHSKWVRVRDGRIIGFDTFMTGELFAVLREHSLLGKPAREEGSDTVSADAKAAAFARGLAVARESGPEGVAGRLFTTRSLYLTGELPPAATLDYLSGMLVGEEIRSAVAAHRGRPLPAIVLIGDATLCGRYHEAVAAFGVTQARVLGDSAAAGLWQVAGVAGLVSAARDPFRSAPHG